VVEPKIEKQEPVKASVEASQAQATPLAEKSEAELKVDNIEPVIKEETKAQPEAVGVDLKP
jgi:hypothetical protein